MVCEANIQTKWTTHLQGHEKLWKKMASLFEVLCLFGSMSAYILTLWLIDEIWLKTDIDEDNDQDQTLFVIEFA